MKPQASFLQIQHEPVVFGLTVVQYSFFFLANSKEIIVERKFLGLFVLEIKVMGFSKLNNNGNTFHE